jgi:hypothetical protein
MDHLHGQRPVIGGRLLAATPSRPPRRRASDIHRLLADPSGASAATVTLL